MRLNRLGLNLTILAISCFMSLLIAEVALRLLVPAETRYYVLRPGARLVLNPEQRHVPGVQGPAHYVINSQGVRGRELATDGPPEYRILAIGGSTTELLYIDGPRSWPALLEASLGKTRAGEAVWVGNVGRSGLNARDHALGTKYLPRQYSKLDAVLVLAGVNDLTVALGQGHAYELPPPVSEPAAERAQVRRAFAVAPGTLAHPATDAWLPDSAPFYKATAVYQLLKRARFAVTSRYAQHGLTQDTRGQTLSNWRSHRQQATRILDELPDLELPLLEFRRNLDIIVEQARAQGLRLVLLTQPYLWRADLTAQEQRSLWLGGASTDFQLRPGSAYYSAGALAIAMNRFNQVTLDICRQHSIECIDLAALVPRTSQMFYDDVHFTDAGSAAVADAITSYLSARAPFLDR